MSDQLNVSNGVGKGDKKRRRLSAEDRYQIFLEASRGDLPVARIRELVRKGALDCLYRGNGKVKEDPQVSRLEAEKARLEEAVKELAIENTLLRKKVG